jgi:hypothetical protein
MFSMKGKNKNKKGKKKNNKTAQIGLMLRLAYSMPVCLPEVTLRPNGPATVQLDQDFPWFSLIPV